MRFDQSLTLAGRRRGFLAYPLRSVYALGMSAKETTATIERIRRVSANLQRLELGVDESLRRIKPGQYVLARPTDSWDPYLPQCWTPVALSNNTVTFEQPGTDHYQPGQTVTLLGPVGAPFPLRPNLRNLLLIALDTPLTALALLATLAVRSKVGVTLVRSGEAQRYPLDLLPQEVEVLEGDLDSGWPNQVMTLGWADQVIAVAEPVYRLEHYQRLVERISELRAQIPQRFFLGLFDQALLCGMGACQGCALPHEGGHKLICVDGPAQDLTKVILA